MVGNQVDLSIGELCGATLDDPFHHRRSAVPRNPSARPSRAFALEAAERDKPVLAYKLGGRTRRRLSVSHTGALAGEDDIAEAFLKECESPASKRWKRCSKRPAAPGADAGLVPAQRKKRPCRRGDDHRRRRGDGGGPTRCPQYYDRTADDGDARKRSRRPASRSARAHRRSHARAERAIRLMKGALDVRLAAPESDLIVVVPGSSARFSPGLAVRPLIEIRAGAEKPLAAFVVPEAPGHAGAADRGRRAQFPHAEVVRRCDCGGLCAADAEGRAALNARGSWPWAFAERTGRVCAAGTGWASRTRRRVAIQT